MVPINRYLQTIDYYSFYYYVLDLSIITCKRPIDQVRLVNVKVYGRDTDRTLPGLMYKVYVHPRYVHPLSRRTVHQSESEASWQRRWRGLAQLHRSAVVWYTEPAFDAAAAAQSIEDGWEDADEWERW